MITDNTTSPTIEDIKAMRLDLGLSQPKCAKLVYVPTDTWKKWEYGINPMPAATWHLFRLKTGLLKQVYLTNHLH